MEVGSWQSHLESRSALFDECRTVLNGFWHSDQSRL